MQIVQRIYVRTAAFEGGQRPKKGTVTVAAFDNKARHLQNCVLETLVKDGDTYAFQRTYIGLAGKDGKQITHGIVAPARQIGDDGFPTLGVAPVPQGTYVFKSLDELRAQAPTGKGARQHQSAIMSIESAMRQLRKKPRKTFPGVVFKHPTGKVFVGKGSKWQPKMLAATTEEFAPIDDFSRIAPRSLHFEIGEDLRYWTKYDQAVVDSWSDGLLAIQNIKAAMARHVHSEVNSKPVSA